MLPPIVSLVFDWSALSEVTSGPGTGGELRQQLEDFQVEEIPAYPLSGEGEHLYLYLEKRGVTTAHMVRELGSQLGIKEKQMGVAGLKDKHALTRQWISIPAKFEHKLDRFVLDGVQILQTDRHTNKLGLGHLQGNRFMVRVREAAGQAERAEQLLQQLMRQGVPNYFGPQRFGLQGLNAEEGVRVLTGESKVRDPRVKRFLISSVQSLIFNHFVSLRLQRNLFNAVLVGDMAKKHDTGGVFMVEDAAVESVRAAAGEISATGTLFGKKTKPLTGGAGELEREALATFHLSPETFAGRRGDRRLTRIFLKEASIEATEDGYRANLVLPKGSFATSVLRELMKVSVDVVGSAEP